MNLRPRSLKQEGESELKRRVYTHGLRISEDIRKILSGDVQISVSVVDDLKDSSDEEQRQVFRKFDAVTLLKIIEETEDDTIVGSLLFILDRACFSYNKHCLSIISAGAVPILMNKIAFGSDLTRDRAISVIAYCMYCNDTIAPSLIDAGFCDTLEMFTKTESVSHNIARLFFSSVGKPSFPEKLVKIVIDKVEPDTVYWDLVSCSLAVTHFESTGQSDRSSEIAEWLIGNFDSITEMDSEKIDRRYFETISFIRVLPTLIGEKILNLLERYTESEEDCTDKERMLVVSRASDIFYIQRSNLDWKGELSDAFCSFALSKMTYVPIFVQESILRVFSEIYPFNTGLNSDLVDLCFNLIRTEHVQHYALLIITKFHEFYSDDSAFLQKCEDYFEEISEIMQTTDESTSSLAEVFLSKLSG